MTDAERFIYQLEHRRVVCAANQFSDGTMLLGARHWDLLMHAQADAKGIQAGKEERQGFIDQYGNFLTRKEAWKVAKKQNQIFRLCGGQVLENDNESLYSENLY